tara:strand:+ start:123003 stop:124985 length:1983 start_codon:yes stop_codon:yes gene_type:complete
MERSSALFSRPVATSFRYARNVIGRYVINHTVIEHAVLCRNLLIIGVVAGFAANTTAVSAQVRTKRPDRGAYQAPTVGDQNAAAEHEVVAKRAGVSPGEPKIARAIPELKAAPVARTRTAADARAVAAANQQAAARRASTAQAKWGAPLEDTQLVDITDIANRPPGIANHSASTNKSTSANNSASMNRVAGRTAAPRQATQNATLQPVAYAEQLLPVDRQPLRDPGTAGKTVVKSHRTVAAQNVWIDEPVHHAGSHSHAHLPGEVIYEDAGLAGPVFSDSGCDGGACDALIDDGCDSMFGGNSTLSFSPERWFWSAELLMMHRRGTRIPALVTTTTDADPDDETAGQLGEAGTVILEGNDSILRDVTAGGRITIGTWLDNCQDRSMVLRAWFAGKETHGFSTDQTINEVIARPFFNETDGQTAEQDTQLVAFPDRNDGSISVRGESNVAGADFSVRQEWWNNCGLNIDLLYGYQYMYLDESLGISTFSTSLDDDFAPVGSTLALNDFFDTENEFHGGQLGITSLYREGCWSLRSLAKVGFGSLRRESNLVGSNVRTTDGVQDVDDQGLLVRQTNSGRTEDHTFGWVPELDFTLGWHRFPRFDTTIGYHVIAMTDAIQPGGLIDTNVNLADTPTGSLSPAATFNYRTFYVHGIHFGLAYIY